MDRSTKHQLRENMNKYEEYVYKSRINFKKTMFSYRAHPTKRQGIPENRGYAPVFFSHHRRKKKTNKTRICLLFFSPSPCDFTHPVEWNTKIRR